MEKNKRVILLLLMFLAFSTYNRLLGQKNNYVLGKDTIMIGSYMLIIELPLKSTKKVTKYEEGVFITYSSKDSALITIHYGAMVSKPLFLGTTQKCTIINKFVFENELYSYNGFCLPIDTINDNRKSNFREFDFINKKITLMYEFVSDANIKTYDNVLNNIIIK